ncbi:General secretion pathway protein K [Rhodovastum atsumiense]|uniref:General secretion pathway protein GspK n=1 Tax=Rhodovastum atsumiense TaxID=504468 RepID=A0A5M6IM86_9PROT|nr:type II secretion system protein GspK [Rhodovastum atsumiense]KAA5609403.1 general secretion pathway protein GspK [Rhodovastum atsumiense]CAH2601840.1 General secretion pathway protein K [Rhodovastum atsumiense]
MRRKRPPPRGFALLVVLWTVALLALLGTHVTATARQAASLSLRLRDAAAAGAAADGLVAEAIFRLLDPSPRRWVADGTRRMVRLEGGVAEIRLQDHAGRVNPAYATPQLLAALLRHEGVRDPRATALGTAIVDWAGSGDADASGKSKAARYRAAGKMYGPPNDAFLTPDELGLVLGMTPDVVERLAPHLSVWTGRRVDLGRADPVVARALQDIGAGSTGLLQEPPDGSAPPLVVEILAQAQWREARAMRRVVVRIDPADKDAPRPWRILAWD